MATQFAHPGLLWLLTVIAPMVAYHIYRTRQGEASISISSVAAVEKSPRTARYYLRHLPFVLRCAAVALVVVALARPRNTEYNSTSTTEGIDIVLAIDVSTSMLARDFDPDRIGAAKDVASRFVMDRTNDRIGIVVFAGESYTQSPLTTDKRALVNLMGQVRSGIIEDGTAIGNGLATAVNRLRESDAESKVVILLTDGVNNAGQIPPMTAAEIANTFGIKVYTIGVGKMGTAPYPAYDAWGRFTYAPAKVEIDEDILRQISGMTGGEYFRATDKSTLKEIYDRINSLETSKVEVNDYMRYNELYQMWLLAATLLLAAEVLIRQLWLRQIP